MPLARGRGSLKKADEGGEWGEKGRVKEGLNRLPCGLWREIYLDKGRGHLEHLVEDGFPSR